MQFTAEQIMGGYDPQSNPPLNHEGQITSPQPRESLEGLGGNVADNSVKATREHRDRLLLLSDWTQGADSPLSDEKKAEWATYRQELRDITSIEDLIGIHDPRWPVAPV